MASSSPLFCPDCGAANNPQDATCFACGQPLQDDPTSTHTGTLHVLKQRYHILQQLGQGGMGAVYKVGDTELGNRLAAVKEMGQRGLSAQEALRQLSSSSVSRGALPVSQPLLKLSSIQSRPVQASPAQHVPSSQGVHSTLSASATPQSQSRSPQVIPPIAPSLPQPPLFLPIGTLICRYVQHTDWISSVAWSPDGKYVASASYDKTVQIWDAATAAMSLLYKGKWHSGRLHGVVWSPNGRRIASAGDDKTVHIWNAKTGEHILAYRAHTRAVKVVVWSPGSTHIASAGEDTTVQLWDALTGKLTFTYQGHHAAVYTIAWSPDGTRLASGDAHKKVQVWRTG